MTTAQSSLRRRIGALALGLSLLVGPTFAPAAATPASAQAAPCDPFAADGCGVAVGTSTLADLATGTGVHTWWVVVDEAGEIDVAVINLTAPVRFKFTGNPGYGETTMDSANLAPRVFRMPFPAGRYRFTIESLTGAPLLAPYTLVTSKKGAPTNCETPRVGLGAKDGGLVDPGAELPAGSTRFTAELFCTNVKPDQLWGIAWQYEGTNITVDPNRGRFGGHVLQTITLHREGGALPGNYAAIFLFDGAEVQRASFTVR